MRAGRLRHRVTICRLAESRDAVGGVTETWQALKTVWASVEPVTAREYVEHVQVHSDITTSVLMRVQPDVTVRQADRLQFRGKWIEIVAPPIDRDKRGIHLELLCREIDP
ncbi:phage head closure protein [Candidatus Thiothrix sp. Deng01]|uniref:Phage head closure protein n=1 Tax=Candidatus Thiothrix phosphatis TaxID=3112415 RepID=A0ABU6CWN3_9GAMM|nr:phage head closure protein [Candidatus Thiothrix sp. Deng01]MEB4590493.1 phage head closure protein [Candidatus Thiothrix sp. Deng01]